MQSELRREDNSSLGKGNTSTLNDDLSRHVYGVLGIPIDAIDFPALMQAVKIAAEEDAPFLISTPNVNFLVKSQTDIDFRESMLTSNLCLADGMPLIWIAKLLGIPLPGRVAGADLFVRLKATNVLDRKLKIFLLGGGEGVAELVAHKLNKESLGIECVGALNPGFGSIDELSSAEIIDAINASSADLLAIFFGAEKAQAWLMHNHDSLTVPIRSQFGATINFEAGTVKRAPRFMRSTGFEWLWRIKEEPYLWRRYWNDGMALSRLLVTGVLPLMLIQRRASTTKAFSIVRTEYDDTVILALSGAAVAKSVPYAIEQLRAAFGTGKRIVVDLTDTEHIDARFLGLFLVARKQLDRRRQPLALVGASARLRRIFRLSRFEYLLSAEL
jgi:N-acetylglucosaminyldiphosphoundecaprenol N-acetyl-beta-D-mannosaminyltransferase